jgi:hypothetical protein
MLLVVRGSFASQLANFENFLRQKSMFPHIVAQARSEDDLKEADIVEKLNKAKGANFARAVTKKEGTGVSLQQRSNDYAQKLGEKDREINAYNKQRDEQRKQEAEIQRKREEERIHAQAE